MSAFVEARLAAWGNLAHRAAAVAAAEREQALAVLEAILNTRIEVNSHGAVELTDAQIDTLLASVATRPTAPGFDQFRGIPIWRAVTTGDPT